MTTTDTTSMLFRVVRRSDFIYVETISTRHIQKQGNYTRMLRRSRFYRQREDNRTKKPLSAGFSSWWSFKADTLLYIWNLNMY